MDVSIILVSYNSRSLLGDCISSIVEKVSSINYEIILVDNASTDRSVEYVETSFPHVIIIRNHENTGFSKANNIGAAIANGKYLFFLNTDTILMNNAVKILFDYMELVVNKDVGACGGNLFKNDGSPNFSYTMYFPSLWAIFCYRSHMTFMINNESFNTSDEPKDVAVIIGADLLIRKEVFLRLNGFDTNFFMYVEDTELSLRLKKMGLRSVSNPDAKIVHLQGASSNSLFKLRTEIVSYLHYFRKYHNSIVVEIYKALELFFILLKAGAYLIMFKRQLCMKHILLFRSVFTS